VAAGLIGLSTVWLLSLLGYVKPEHAERIDVLALYWHFVDSVWIVVVMVVYVIGR
jgi:cytochrome c oxidase subunit 3/cytochrome o ubiquinol oxidase subunit 3